MSDHPVFMSDEHIDLMRQRLQGSAEVISACHDLDRMYGLSFVLSDGPDGDVRWQMTFDVDTGVSVDTGDPPITDLTYRGDWAQVLESLIALRRGEPVTVPMRSEGPAEVLDRIGAAYEVAQRIASMETILPETTHSRPQERR